ncbi:MAG: hypothetical protein COA58_14990 [Bacteroidetes bacterium]|nr:MAG: hypothetical protein COA58_14990 [Bacteroidota bacterium]
MFINPTNNKKFTVGALLDTGADVCHIPKGLAVALGYDLDDPRIITRLVTGVEGTPVPMKEIVCDLHLMDATGRKVIMKSKGVQVRVNPSDAVPAILGTTGFLENLQVAFNYKTKNIKIYT